MVLYLTNGKVYVPQKKNLSYLLVQEILVVSEYKPKSQESAVRNNEHSNNNKTNGRCYLLELTQPGVSVPLSFNICAVVNAFITRLPFRVWR
jgi:hypothetical protein